MYANTPLCAQGQPSSFSQRLSYSQSDSHSNNDTVDNNSFETNHKYPILKRLKIVSCRVFLEFPNFSSRAPRSNLRAISSAAGRSNQRGRGVCSQSHLTDYFIFSLLETFYTPSRTYSRWVIMWYVFSCACSMVPVDTLFDGAWSSLARLNIESMAHLKRSEVLSRRNNDKS